MQIQAEKREKFGKQNKSLRKERKVPAVVYGSGLESTPLVVDLVEFVKVYKETGETALIDLKFNGFDEKVLVKSLQVDPVSLSPIHVDFFKVDLTEKIKANIPVEVVGEENCEVVVKGEGMVLVLLNEIEVESLPQDLPQQFEVDVSNLQNIDDAITVNELNFDKEKVELMGVEDEDLVLKIDYAEMEEEPEEEEVSEEELIEGIEATAETAEGEGEETTEGTTETKEKEDETSEE